MKYISKYKQDKLEEAKKMTLREFVDTLGFAFIVVLMIAIGYITLLVTAQ